MLLVFFIKMGILGTVCTFIFYDIQEAIEVFFIWIGIISVYIICCAVKDVYTNKTDDFIF